MAAKNNSIGPCERIDVKYLFVTGKNGGHRFEVENPSDRLDFLCWWIEFLKTIDSANSIWKESLTVAEVELCEISDFLGRPEHRYFPTVSIYQTMP